MQTISLDEAIIDNKEVPAIDASSADVCPISAAIPKRKRQSGSAKGLIEMMPDFDEPLEDFKEYME